jgi:hypothetical protein
MAKYAIVVMSEHSEGNPGGQARLLHALSAAKDFDDAGEDVSIWFHGVGAPASAQPGQPKNWACHRRRRWPHHTVAALAADGYQVLTF